MAGFETRHEIGGARNHDPVEQKEDGGQPLTSGCIDVKITHDAWQCRADDGLVDRTKKAAGHHKIDGCLNTFADVCHKFNLHFYSW